MNHPADLDDAHLPLRGVVFVVDADLRIWTFNRVAREALAAHDALGREFTDVFPERWFGVEKSVLHELFRRTLAGGESFLSGSLRDDERGFVVPTTPWRLRRVFVPGGYGVACAFTRDLPREARTSAPRMLEQRTIEQRTPVDPVFHDELLGRLSCELLGEDDSGGLYEKFVDAALTIMRATHATLQIHHPERGPGGALHLIAARGFSDEARRAWEWVERSDLTTCGEALRRGTRVVTPDIESCEFLMGTAEQAEYRREGVRSGQTTPLLSRDGRILGMISTFWFNPHVPSARALRMLDLLARQAADLIERTAAVETLRRSEEQLRDADRRKDEFLAMLAHELRNPIAPIGIGLELIRRAGNDVASITAVRSMMERQLGHLVRLIDDLLDVSRIRSGKIELRRQPTALRDVVAGAIEATQAATEGKGVAFDVELPTNEVWLDADPTRLVQVLANVMNNAVKFSPANGRVSLTATLDRAARGGGEELRIVVADRGIGISEEFLPRIFEFFTQDEQVREEAHAGLGIGLALARQLIEMHGGSVTAESAGPGLGSAITLRLPVVHAQAVETAPSTALSPGIAGRRVLVVDDNRDSANAMKRLVDVMGGDCRVAYGGVAGLQSVAEFRPELVLLDITMPDLTGFEVCRRIRAEYGDEICVVALTGWGQERDQRAAKEAGFDLHFTKPLDPDLLESLLVSPRARAAQLAQGRPNVSTRT